MQDTWVQSLGWEDHREKGMATTSVFLPGEYYGQRNLVGYSPWGHKESDTTEAIKHSCIISTTVGKSPIEEME